MATSDNSTAPGVAPPLPSIGIMFGPPLIGISIACMLFGSMWNQCILYYTRFPKDKTWLKCYVGILLMLDVVGTVFALWWIYDLLVDNFGNFSALGIVTFRLAVHPILVGVQAIICQAFFIWRVKVLTGKIWLTIPLLFLCLVSLACTIGLSTYISINTDLSKFYDVLPHTLGAIWLSVTAFIDVFITATLSFYLGHRKTGFRKTDHIINKIIAGTVQNGLVTSACAIVELGAFLGLPNSGLHIAFVFILPKVYGNTVMSSLNARRREGRSTSFTMGPTIDFLSHNHSSGNDTNPPIQSKPMYMESNDSSHEMHGVKFKESRRHSTSSLTARGSETVVSV